VELSHRISSAVIVNHFGKTSETLLGVFHVQPELSSRTAPKIIETM
jgi:hypothetical protein